MESHGSWRVDGRLYPDRDAKMVEMDNGYNNGYKYEIELMNIVLKTNNKSYTRRNEKLHGEQPRY